jgi:transcriptional regulator with XRE-family HTH domain
LLSCTPVENSVKTTNEILGERLKKLREEKGLTQDDVAQAYGTSRSHVDELEKGKKNFTGPTYDKFIRACGSTPEAVLETGIQGAIPQDLAWMLSSIVKTASAGVEGARLLEGIRINLEVISKEARRLLQKRSRDRPSPAAGPEKDLSVGDAAHRKPEASRKVRT